MQLGQDGFEHKLRMRQNVVVPKADHPPAVAIQVRGSAAIRFGRSDVLSAVEFDDEMTIHAHEVREVRADRMLSSEAEPSQASMANVKP